MACLSQADDVEDEDEIECYEHEDSESIAQEDEARSNAHSKPAGVSFGSTGMDREAMLCTAEGLQLIPSESSRTGFKGVRGQGSRFQVRLHKILIGYFDTAEEGAAAYAQALQRETQQALQREIVKTHICQPDNGPNEGIKSEENSQSGQSVASFELLDKSKPPPKWSKLMDYGKLKGYRGPMGQRASTLREV